jgi:endonuclease/exonuclease/phosphatase family metal-dependent hydrolase
MTSASQIDSTVTQNVEGPALPLASRLTLLTVNTHKGFTSFNRRLVLHELREALRSAAADVVFLQEVVGEHRAHPLRWPHWPTVSQYEFLADSIWPAYAYGRNATYPEGHHGNALLSKYPIARWRNHDVSITGPERRGLLHCTVELPGRALPLHAICVHLGLRSAHRRQQLDLLCALLDREVPPDAPLAIAGDFNDWQLHANQRLRECAGVKEVFLDRHGHCARTFPARWPWLRLDRIYVRNLRAGRLSVLSRHPWSHLSDHVALLAEVEL